MPKVPVYQQQVQTVSPTVQAPVTSRLPAAAFGGDVQAATTKLSEQVQKTGSLLAERAIQLQEREDDTQILKTQASAQSDINAMLTNAETDDSGKPKGFLSRQFANAKGSTQEFDQVIPQIREKYLSMAVGRNQQVALDRALTTQLTTAREQISRHEANQLDADFKETSKETLDNYKSQAQALDDPIHVGDLIGQAHADFDRIARHEGISGDRLKFAKQNLAGQIVESAVMGNIDKNPLRAQAIYEANKENIGQYRTKVEDALHGKMLYEEENNLWQSVDPKANAQYRLPDGNADVSKMLARIDGLDMSEERKKQHRAAIESRASVYDSNLKRERAGLGREFTNTIIDFKSQGGSVTDALMKAKGFSYDATDLAENQAAIRKLYASNEASDPETVIALYKGIESGELQDPKVIRTKFNSGLLSSADYVKFSDKLYDAQTKVPDAKQKLIWDGIELQAKDKFGTGASAKDQINKFMYTVRVEADEKKFKSRDEIQGLADDMLKRVTVPFDRHWPNPMRVFGPQGFDEKTNYQVNYEQNIARDRSAAELKASLGPEVYKAMGNDPAQVVKVIGSLGGVEATKSGTPTNNAMKSLSALGFAITPQKIKDVIRQTGGTGIIPPDATVRLAK